jgi:hypothetical protein
VELTVPRDRDSSFEPRIVGKRQRRLTGVDEMVISLSAKGLTHGEIAAHLAEVYGAEVSKQTITTITDRVMEGMSEWQGRPLDPGRIPLVVANPHQDKDDQAANVWPRRIHPAAPPHPARPTPRTVTTESETEPLS